MYYATLGGGSSSLRSGGSKDAPVVAGRGGDECEDVEVRRDCFVHTKFDQVGCERGKGVHDPDRPGQDLVMFGLCERMSDGILISEMILESRLGRYRCTMKLQAWEVYA